MENARIILIIVYGVCLIGGFGWMAYMHTKVLMNLKIKAREIETSEEEEIFAEVGDLMKHKHFVFKQGEVVYPVKAGTRVVYIKSIPSLKSTRKS